MKNIIDDLLQKYPIRRTRAQKDSFRQYAKKIARTAGIKTTEERNSYGSVNLVFGSMKHARVVISAHYDTPKRSFFPMLYCYDKPWVSYLLSLFSYVVPAVVIILLVPLAFFLPIWLGVTVLMKVAFTNRHNANSNTSGVALLLMLMRQLTPAQRKKTVLVLLDHKEKSMRGAVFFCRKYQQQLKEMPLINLDCVGCGNTFGLLANKQSAQIADKIAAALTPFLQERTVFTGKQKDMLFPSDHIPFPQALTLMSFLKKPRLGRYLGPVKSSRDTLIDSDNLEQLTAGLQHTVDTIF